MATANLEELSKSLELSHNEQSPEDYIRKTLRAHGFFQHITPEKTSGRRKEKRGISEEDKKRTTQLIYHFKEGREFHTLKEPRHLYGYVHSSQHDSYQKLPFWPFEIECIREKPTLLMIPPKHAEPYYTVDSELVSPKIRSGEGHGKIVYMNLPGPEKYYVKSRQGHSINLPPTQTDLSLQFESRFESGNLSKAIQVGRWDYELYLRHDLYTKKHTQWFYFRVRNMQAGRTYRFTIVNLYKAGSLYNEGMQPVFYSECEAKEQQLGWHRAGYNIKYFKTPIKRLDTKQESFCYGVTWSYTFRHNGDTCFFAHSFPYTYSDLQGYLQKILTNKNKAQFCKYKILCHTVAGNAVPLLTITSPSLTPDDSQAKRGVVVTARIHPGETNGSWMMKGLLDFLTSSADDAKILRDLFVFKIIPMLNPDGVIVGNYRCSLSGRDLNRNYRSKLKDSYPTVWHTRDLVKQFCKEREVVLFCDLHGHSRKHNIFIYGCDALDDVSSRLKSRVFPRMLCKNAPDMFSYNCSRFVVQKSKESTGRVVMWRQAGIQNSYTLEATFAGSTQGKLKGIQFSTAHLEDMGYHLCDTLLDYCDPDQSKTERIMRELEDDYRKSVLTALAALGQEIPPGVDPLDIKIDPALAEADSSDGGSDSSESDGPPVHLQCKYRKTKKKKRLKSRKERNKQKALLKMNHRHLFSTPTSSLPQPLLPTDTHSPKKLKPEAKNEKRNELMFTPQQQCDILTSHPSTHNGGIPSFVQGRLEERQRRREEEESSNALGCVPSEELRLALMHIQATHTEKAPSSTIFIPHPSCPMNISQVNMHDISRRQSRYNSKISLPKLDSTSSSGIPPELPPIFSTTMSKGAFTSQYVAHHLQHIGTNPTKTAGTESTSNNTQHLSTLSRLFRQLHPQTHQSSHTADNQQPHIKPTPHTIVPHGKEVGNMLCEQRSNHHENQDELRRMKHKSVTTIFRDYDVTNEIKEPTSFEERRADEIQITSNSKPNTTQTHTASYSIAPPNGEISSEARSDDYNLTSSSHLSRGSSSPMTNSWEGFSQGVTYMKKKQETKKETIRVKEHESKRKRKVELRKRQHKMMLAENVETNRILIDAQLAAVQDNEENSQNFIDYLTQKQAGRQHYVTGQNILTEPTSLSSQRSNSPTKLIELPIDKMRTAAIKTHKQGVADAVENAHTTRMHDKKSFPSDNHDPLSLPKCIPKSKSDPLPSSRLLTPLPNHCSDMQRSHLSQQAIPEISASVDRHGEGRTFKQGSRADRVRYRTEEVRVGRSLEYMDNTKAYYNETRPDTDTLFNTTTEEETQLRRVYSSKPPSRYGPRPGPDDGVPPVTVSLMLSGRPRSNYRPSTMHSNSKRHGKHAHIRYFTKRT